MVGKTPRIRKSDRDRFDVIKSHCGCLPCLLTGHLDRHTSIEHITDRGQRVGKDSAQHEATIGLCAFHHYGSCDPGVHRDIMEKNYGPSLAHGRKPFESFFGDELTVLLPIQDYLLEQFAENPWPEYNLPRNVARLTRHQWINLNANAQRASI